jgi:polyisoprenoid-binding protein YceI
MTPTALSPFRGARLAWSAALALAVAAGAGCSENEAKTDKPAEKPAVTVAPTATALAPQKPATMDAKKAAIEKEGSKIEFSMDAPEEKIHGRATGATSGELAIDFMDLSKTTGLVNVDIAGLELFQMKADKGGKFGDETKVEKQNEHARAWLEIGPKTEEAERKKNEKVQFSIKSIEVMGEKDLSKMTGAERKVTLKATGDFLLHGHKSEKVVELEATFKMEGDKPVSVAVKTAKPFGVVLAEHEVKPRDAVGKLLLKGLEQLSSKVAKEAMVSLELTAKVEGAGPTSPAKAP